MEASGLERPVPRQNLKRVPLSVASRVESFPFDAIFYYQFGVLNLYENRTPAVRGRFVVVSFTALVELMKTSARVSVRF
jgi:hypothetical protein